MPALFAAQPGKSSGLIVSCSPCCLCPPSLHFPRTCSMSSLFAASGSHSLSCTTNAQVAVSSWGSATEKAGFKVLPCTLLAAATSSFARNSSDLMGVTL